MSYKIECDGCSAAVVVETATDPDSSLGCDCCPEDHHHGQAASESGTPCRPITITAQGPAARLTAEG
jgi:hypothetical protein